MGCACIHALYFFNKYWICIFIHTITSGHYSIFLLPIFFFTYYSFAIRWWPLTHGRRARRACAGPATPATATSTSTPTPTPIAKLLIHDDHGPPLPLTLFDMFAGLRSSLLPPPFSSPLLSLSLSLPFLSPYSPTPLFSSHLFLSHLLCPLIFSYRY